MKQSHHLSIISKRPIRNTAYCCLLLLAACLTSCSDKDEVPVVPPEPEPEPEAVFQASIGLTTLDPSKFCPLSVRFRIDMPTGGSVRATVLSKPNAKTPPQEHLFPYSAEAHQFIDVLGLYADYDNQVKLAFLDSKGIERRDTTVTITTPPLTMPNVPQTIRVLHADVNRMEEGMNLILFTPMGDQDTSMPYMLDADGEIRYLLHWRESERMSRTIVQAGFSRMKDGNWLAGDHNIDQNTGSFHIVSPLGEELKSYNLFETHQLRYHHEVKEMANGNLIATMTAWQDGADTGSSRIRDKIIEVNPVSGDIVHRFDLTTMLDPERFGNKVLGVVPTQQSASNWVHNNAITDWGENYLAGTRYQGAFKFDKNGNVAWIISAHRGWTEKHQSKLLAPLHKDGTPITDPDVIDGAAAAEDFDWIWGSHTPVVLPPNGNLQRVLIYDNGLARFFTRNNIAGKINYSRAVIYEIDEEKMTIRQEWEYGKEDPNHYTNQRSNVAYLPKTKHVLFCPSGGAKLSSGLNGACIIEVDPATNEELFHLEIENGDGFHRAYRVSLYP
jgi:arylsulfate sulfotransferase